MISSVIFTQAYNASATVGRTIESILNQTLSDFEYYILDNGSTDDTEDVICAYAKMDKRIKPIRVNTNDITNGGAFFTLLKNIASAKYIVWCDADDAYTPDFLENMVRFSTENQLDIAACGYDKIDGETNEIIKHRALSENLVLHDSLFVEEFIKYRGFTPYLWGKLYSIPFLREKAELGTERHNRICNDSILTLMLFRKAKRAGIYGKSMYKYYQYPRSLSHRNIENSLHSYKDLYRATRKHLEHYGPISKLNEDFLHAIHLSLVEEAVGNIFAAKMPTDAKLGCLRELFDNSDWAKTLVHDADPQFRNLAARREFVDGMKSRILALPSMENSTNAADILRCLNIE